MFCRQARKIHDSLSSPNELGTSASLLVTSALLVGTMFALAYEAKLIDPPTTDKPPSGLQTAVLYMASQRRKKTRRRGESPTFIKTFEFKTGLGVTVSPFGKFEDSQLALFLQTRNKKLLGGAPGFTTRSKDATNGLISSKQAQAHKAQPYRQISSAKKKKKTSPNWYSKIGQR